MLSDITMRSRSSIKTATALNDATTPLAAMGAFNVSIMGTWVGTIKLQRSFNYILFKSGKIEEAAVTWGDVKTYTANVEEVGTFSEPEIDVFYRLIVTAYTSGAAALRMSF